MLAFSTIHLAKPMPFSPADNAIMTIREVADFLMFTERTICRLTGVKQIPAFKVGGSWRFSKADLDKWIEQLSTQTDNRTTNATLPES